MSNFTKDATRLLKTVGEYTWKGAKIVIPIAGVILLNGSRDRLLDKIELIGDVTYSDAVSAIMRSKMFSSDKTRAITALKKDGDSEFYKSVIQIVRGGMFSSDKVKIILNMSE